MKKALPMIDGLPRILHKMSDMSDKIYFLPDPDISWRIQIYENGQWLHPSWMPAKGFQDGWQALESCIRGFPLGTARVVRMEVINSGTVNVTEMPQRTFLRAYEIFRESGRF